MQNDRIFNKSEDEIKDKIVKGIFPETDYAVKVTNSWEDKMELLNSIEMSLGSMSTRRKLSAT